MGGAPLLSHEEWESEPFTRALGSVRDFLKTPLTKRTSPTGESLTEEVEREYGRPQ